jgi:DHA1 family bicyclomycin/chloramphenicol resistance-like MFS transporter
MNPDADKLWQAPRWALAVLLAVLGMLGPFSIDTYIPAFSGIAQSIGATPAEMQQTLSAYLFGFAFMNLFHGALSDSFGRRPVVLWGLAVFTLASLGCALSQNITQLVLFRGAAGPVDGRRHRGLARGDPRHVPARRGAAGDEPGDDLFRRGAGHCAHRGRLPVRACGLARMFWFLVAVGVVLFTANYKLLPETLHKNHRQPFQVRHLMRGYWDLCSDPRFLLLALASGVPFNGMFLYVLAAPAFLGDHLALQPQQFFWFFLLTIGGIMLGARASGRWPARWRPSGRSATASSSCW